VAKAGGVNIQTVRFYEREGLLPAPRRSAAGYRQFTEDAVRIVTFVKRAQELGFTLREAKQLVRLRSLGPKRAEAAKTAAEAKLRDIDKKIHDLMAMRAALASLVDSCQRSGGPITCPILEALETSSPGP
jgi:MerR family transcriptional regulator, mercuric resistance operon regulatory protein